MFNLPMKDFYAIFKKETQHLEYFELQTLEYDYIRLEIADDGKRLVHHLSPWELDQTNMPDRKLFRRIVQDMVYRLENAKRIVGGYDYGKPKYDL